LPGQGPDHFLAGAYFVSVALGSRYATALTLLLHL